MPSYYIGIMSGTSLDGVDAVLVDFDSLPQHPPKLIEHQHLAYPCSLKKDLLALSQGKSDELHSSMLLSQEVSKIYCAITQSLLKTCTLHPEQIQAIGAHGQTVRHQPAHQYSLQLLDPAWLVEHSNICVICNFRSQDLAAGGQGAPLVPAFHRHVFQDKHHTRAIVNIGGIANLSLLYPNGSVQGFDCGPGNLLMDAWTEKHLSEPFDRDGQWAAKGNVIPELLNTLLDDPYFQIQPPKSTGRDYFNLNWLSARLRPHYASVDIQATLAMLTARSIFQSCQQASELYLCGGGCYNAHVYHLIYELCCQHKISCQSTDTLGIAAEHIEAMAFAWLGWCTLHSHPANVPEVTGAQGFRVLGAIYPRQPI